MQSTHITVCSSGHARMTSTDFNNLNHIIKLKFTHLKCTDANASYMIGGDSPYGGELPYAHSLQPGDIRVGG